MGWWSFGQSSSSSEPASTSSQSSGSAPAAATPQRGSEQPKRLTREQQADAEVEAFLASLEGGPKKQQRASPSNTPAVVPAEPQLQQRSSSIWPSFLRQTPIFPPEPSDKPTDVHVPTSDSDMEEKLDISPRALRPRTMSCRAAFDSAFYCASLGGKFNDVYRFGSLQPCSEHWDAFWFCMRNRSIGGSDDDRGEDIADYYEKREKREMLRRAGGRSSEDIWEMRTEPVEKAFWKVP